MTFQFTIQSESPNAALVTERAAAAVLPIRSAPPNLRFAIGDFEFRSRDPKCGMAPAVTQSARPFARRPEIMRQISGRMAVAGDWSVGPLGHAMKLMFAMIVLALPAPHRHRRRFSGRFVASFHRRRLRSPPMTCPVCCRRTSPAVTRRTQGGCSGSCARCRALALWPQR